MLSALVKVSSLENEINKMVMESVREETSLSAHALRNNPVREMDCSDWAVNLRDTAAFSAANDSLQKTDQSWSTCHVSQSRAAAPSTYSSPLRGCRWSEAAVEGSGERFGEAEAWLQLKTLMLTDHSQKHGRLEMRGQKHTHRDADRQVFKSLMRSHQSVRT